MTLFLLVKFAYRDWTGLYDNCPRKVWAESDEAKQTNI